MNACVHTYTKPQTSSTRSRGLGWRIHESVEDTKLSTNKQHSLSPKAMSSTSKPPYPIPCALAAVLLPGSRAFGCRARKGWFSDPMGERQTTVCVVGVWTVYGVTTRRARGAGVNTSFETTGTCIVRRRGASEGGRV